MELSEYQAIHQQFEEDLYGILDFGFSVASRDAVGGTAPVAVQEQIKHARENLKRAKETEEESHGMP
jgi:argininosuccinate lyase